MSILASVSDVLALLAAGAALIAAARALRVASRLAQRPAATTMEPTTVRSEPNEPAPRFQPAASSRTGTTASKPATNGSSARGNELREQIRAFLADRSDRELSLVEVSNGLGRSSATVSYALEKLVAAGDVELTSPKPRRYRITTAGASASRQADVPAAAPATAPATDRAGEPSGTSAPEPRRAPKPASTPRSANSAKAKGGGLRDEVRAVLASRGGEALSLTEVSGGIGRSTATVSYHLQGLVEAGEVTLVDGKPRRYTIAATVTPSASQAPAQAAAGEPAATATGPSGAVTASGSIGRRGTRSAKTTGGRRPATARSNKKAGAATGKVAAAGK